MTDAGERIKQLIDELDSEEHERVKKRAASSPPDSQVVVKESIRDDAVTSALRRVEKSVNAVKLARGEEPVQIVDSGRGIDESLRAEMERTIAEKDLDPAAVAATLGLRLRDRGRIEEARALFTAAAEQGDVMAAQTLAQVLEDQGLDEEALNWHRFAADKGDHQARYNLGRMLYERGEVEAAIGWLRRSEDPKAADMLQDIESRDR